MEHIKKNAERLRYRGATYYLHEGVIYGPDLQVLIPEATNGFLDLYEYFEYFPQPHIPARNKNEKEKNKMMRSGLKVKVKDGLRSFVRSVYILDGDHWFKHNGELVKIQPLGNGKYRANWFTSVVFPYKEEA